MTATMGSYNIISQQSDIRLSNNEILRTCDINRENKTVANGKQWQKNNGRACSNSKVLSLLRQIVKSINLSLCKRSSRQLRLKLHVTGGWRSHTFVENGSLINSNRCVKTWSTYTSQNSRPSYYRNNGSKPAKYLSLFNSRGLVSKVVGCCAAGYMWIGLRSRWARSFDYKYSYWVTCMAII